ncbi:MAG: glycosyltransferase [Cyanobacteria bacterium CRU_2_1]|nr:glycosyltransferase [Cyanobacteria bacterium RU_5_0]NJR59724.1 glycosyltransferase [Cyanobacteria bacterium CRU_2_1]
MRLLIVQYAGDYRETFYRFVEGKGETYYAQKYSVDAVAEIGQYVEEVATLCCLTENPYDEKLSNGVRAIGAGMQREVDFKKILKLVEAYQPTHLILRTPSAELLRWAVHHKVPTIATLADSFSVKGLRGKLKNLYLAFLLNNKHIHWIGNHGITASRSLTSIGVNSDKVIPWDWPHSVTPESFPAKTLRTDGQPWNLMFIGSIIEGKGVGDALEAVAALKARNFPVRLRLAGKGDIAHFQDIARNLDIEDCVEFLGVIENKAVVGLMQSADLVLIPSRHEYPEGFPMAIYEALCSRTPVIASDHPMFLNHLKNNVSAMIFPASNSAALADRVEQVLTNPDLYERISQTTYVTWNNLQIPVKWAELVLRWVQNSPDNQAWLHQHCLSSEIYHQPEETIAPMPVSQSVVMG